MPRETKAQRNSRISALLAEYDARSREINKLNTIVKGLKEQIREIEPDGYGEWRLSFGNPRLIMDQAAAKLRLLEHDIEVPMVETQRPIVVTSTAGK